ncbi:MAG: tRNA uridine-5-carboxymethylaminomethyl(34) synthesis GTPase MnmE, partial [Planctomycetota bacterium]
MVKQPETRATLQTPPGKGGIAIIALAGPAVDRILADVFRPIRSHADAGADVIRLGHLIDDGRIIDEV